MVARILIIAFFVLWVAAMWFAVIYAAWRGWVPHFRSKRMPKIRMNATIAKKYGRQEFNPVTYQMELMEKVLAFQCEDGECREYEVHDNVWDWVEIGDDGMLIYQGHLFVDFEARRPRHDLDNIYKKLTRT